MFNHYFYLPFSYFQAITHLQLKMILTKHLAPLLKYLIAESGFGFYPDLKIDSVPVELTVTGVDSVESITLPDMTVNGAAVTLPAAETERPVVVTTPEPTDAPEEKTE